MSSRRQVRVSDGFFRQLDQQFGPERGPDGDPSATDFLVVELPAIVEQFATAFEDLPQIVEGVSAGRMLVAAGMLVRAVVVYGIEVRDGSIELIGLEVDR